MKNFLFASLFVLFFSSCVSSSYSDSYRYEYNYEYCYRGQVCPVIYVNNIAMYYYLNHWYCIPSGHHCYIRPVNRASHFHYSTPYYHNHYKPTKPKPNKPVHRPHNKEGVLNNDRLEYKRPFPSHNKPRSNRRSISDKRVKK